MNQTTHDRLADIAWFLKGMLQAHQLNNDFSCPFDESHLKAIEDAMREEEMSPDVIMITKRENNHFDVETSDKFGDKLGWDEMIGCLSTLTMPNQLKSINGLYMRPKDLPVPF